MKKQLLVLFALVAVMGTNVQARSLKNDYLPVFTRFFVKILCKGI